MSISPGALRFNTDSQKLELYDGNQWTEIVATSADSQTGGARGVIGAGYAPGTTNTINYITISSTGNAIDFGDLTQARANGTSGYSSSTRGIFGCGQFNPGTASSSNVLDYITISSTGNAIDFGDATIFSEGYTGLSNSIRGIAGGGFHRSPGAGVYVNTLDYTTIASTGNAVDFGDITSINGFSPTAASNTRGIFGPGNGTPSVIDFITISTLGNAARFGDPSDTRYGIGSGIASNAIRGVFGGGEDYTPGTKMNLIDYITIATLGNAIDFGDMTQARSDMAFTSSSVRIAFCGGTGPAIINVIDYVTIMSTGDATDFGDLITATSTAAGLSNGHGGL